MSLIFTIDIPASLLADTYPIDEEKPDPFYESGKPISI
jgi:hypothetical protein